jgi:hypothetical protein
MAGALERFNRTKDEDAEHQASVLEVGPEQAAARESQARTMEGIRAETEALRLGTPRRVVLEDGSEILVGRMKAGPVMEAFADLVEILPYIQPILQKWMGNWGRLVGAARDAKESGETTGFGALLMDTICADSKNVRPILKALRHCVERLLCQGDGWADEITLGDLVRLVDAIVAAGGWREIAPFFARWVPRALARVDTVAGD